VFVFIAVPNRFCALFASDGFIANIQDTKFAKAVAELENIEKTNKIARYRCGLFYN
jgi:hypothetical protein